MKRIFYCNVTYGCNSNCVFCYSHNTRHNGLTHNEIDIETYLDYLKIHMVGAGDRVIVNGGEPLLYSRIQELLDRLAELKCDVLVYSNGRLLEYLNLDRLTENFRFIIPIHGFRELHDKITGVEGSYDETIKGLHSICGNKCSVDIKIIINYEMITSDENFSKTMLSLEQVPFNHAVHLTKMADTIISEKNKCTSVDSILAAKYTKKLYEYYKDKCKVKIFDTCIKDLLNINMTKVLEMPDEIEVFFKDFSQEFKVELEKPYLECMKNCEKSKYCHSAVGEYTVLEFYGDKIYIEME